jgi:hypothetical protein
LCKYDILRSYMVEQQRGRGLLGRWRSRQYRIAAQNVNMLDAESRELGIPETQLPQARRDEIELLTAASILFGSSLDALSAEKRRKVLLGRVRHYEASQAQEKS